MTSDEPASGLASKPESSAFDTSTAHQARVYDYFLGGCFLYAVLEDSEFDFERVRHKVQFWSRFKNHLCGQPELF